MEEGAWVYLTPRLPGANIDVADDHDTRVGGSQLCHDRRVGNSIVHVQVVESDIL